VSTLPLQSEVTADPRFDALQREAEQIQQRAEARDQLAAWAHTTWMRMLTSRLRNSAATEGAMLKALRWNQDACHLIAALGEDTCREIIASTRDGAMASIVVDEQAREAESAARRAEVERRAEAARIERERKGVALAPLLELHRSRFAEMEIEQSYEFADLQAALRIIGFRADQPEAEPMLRPWLTRFGFERELIYECTAEGEPIYTEEKQRMLSEYYAGQKLYESDADTTRPYFMLRDNGERCPPSLDDAKAWAEGWRSRLPPSLRDVGMVSVLQPGACVEALVWCREPISGRAVSELLRGLNGSRSEDDDHPPRFVALPEWTPFGTPVLLEPRTRAPKAATLASMRARVTTAAEPTAGVIRTKIAGLDSQLRLGGIPEGALLIVQGPPKACKTTVEIEIACAAREQGYHVAFIAGDESPTEIVTRLWQRAGLAPIEARQRALRGDLPDEGFLVIDPREYPLESILESVRAEPLPTVLVVESIQKLARGGQHEIDALLGMLRATGKTTIAASETVGTGETRRSKGSTGIGYEAHLTLDVTRRKDEVTIRPMLSRLGSEEPVHLRLDALRQTLTAKGTVEPQDETETGARGAVLAALSEQPRSKTWLRNHIQGWRSERILEAVEALELDGEIEKRGTKYVIHGTP
jgi:hypothetical protein